MLSIILFIRLSLRSLDDNCFPAGPIQIHNVFYPPIPENVQIFDSMFDSLTERAITVFTDRKRNLYLERSTFINISSPDNTGAIYYQHKGMTFVSFVCGSDCYTQSSTGSHQFAYFVTSSSSNISIFQSTITKCPGIAGSRNYPLYLGNGFEEINGLNLSSISGISNYASLTIAPTEVSRVAFTNIAIISLSGHYSVQVNPNHFKSNSFHNVNIIANIGATSSLIIWVTGESQTIFERSVFTNNVGRLFYSSTGTYGSFIIVDSFVSHFNSGTTLTTTNGAGKIQLLSFTINANSATPSLALEHLNTALCYAQIPFNISQYYEPLSALCLPPTPPQTLPQPPTNCFSNPQEVQLINLFTVLRPLFASWLSLSHDK